VNITHFQDFSKSFRIKLNVTSSEIEVTMCKDMAEGHLNLRYLNDIHNLGLSTIKMMIKKIINNNNNNFQKVKQFTTKNLKFFFSFI